MNNTSTMNEQSVVKSSTATLINSDDNSMVPNCNNSEQTNGASRFQMIRVDRHFGRGRWKINDFEPAETNSNPNVEHDPSASLTILQNDLNNSSTVTLPTNNAPAVTTTFTQQRLPINNPPLVLPTHGNVPSTAGLLHPFPGAPLANLASSNQSYLLANHPQFGYYPFYPAPYPPAFAAQWAALAAANPYIAPAAQIVSPIPTQAPKTSNLNEQLRSKEKEVNNENSTVEHFSNTGLAATPFLYAPAPRNSHSPYVPQHTVTNASPYATIPSYHPVAPLPTIVPPNQQNKQVSTNPLNSTDLLQTSQNTSQQAPVVSSPKTEIVQNLIQHPALIVTPKTKPATVTTNAQITDLISTSPSVNNSQQAPISLLSPIPTTTNKTLDPTATVLTDIWTYTNNVSPLNIKQSSAANPMNLLGEDNPNNTEITNEILKELTTPTKQNTPTDIDNKISAAMDLVKMHLLSAVREEVTELRQQIEILQEKLSSLEHENNFLRRHVSSEIYAQYIPVVTNYSSNSESTHSAQVASSQTITNVNTTSLPSTAPIQAVTALSTAI